MNWRSYIGPKHANQVPHLSLNDINPACNSVKHLLSESLNSKFLQYFLRELGLNQCLHSTGYERLYYNQHICSIVSKQINGYQCLLNLKICARTQFVDIKAPCWETSEMSSASSSSS